MKKLSITALLTLGLSLSWVVCVHAEDLTDRLELSGLAAAEWPDGQHSFTPLIDHRGTDFGGLVGYGVNKYLSLGFSYDDINLGRGYRMQPGMFNGIIRFLPDSRWTPTLQLGAGVVKGVDDDSYEHLSTKAGIGLEYFVCDNFSIGPQGTFILADDQTTDKQYAQVFTAGLVANLFFGGSGEQPVKQAVAPPPPPPPVAVAVALSPTEATLESSQTVQFTPSVTGTSNPSVTWSIDPDLGDISPNGLYTAPGSVAFAAKVTVTATSQADPSQTAKAVISLTPPAAAAKEVSIELHVLFDSGSDAVKSEFNDDIMRVAKFMKQYPDTKAEIDGHTDNTGSAAFNLRLSQRRADSVSRYLTEKFGIEPSRLSTKGFGGSKPLLDNSTREGRAMNRRVVAVIKATEPASN